VGDYQLSGIWPDWLKAIQLKARYLFGLWLLGLLILLMPKAWADALRITPIRDTAGGVIGIATMAALVFWLVALLQTFQDWRERCKRRTAIRLSLDTLSRQERWLLAYCLIRKRQTLLLSRISSSGNVAAGLCQKGLMIPAAGVQNRFAWPYSIPPFVWRELRRRQRALAPENDTELTAMRQYFQDLDRTADGQQGAIHNL
jgi:hypothetical protein